MGRLKRIKRAFCIWIINSFLSGTHFFELKRLLIRAAGIPCGVGSKVVGPVYLGNVARVRIGSNVWVGTRFAVYGNGSVTLGDGCVIAVGAVVNRTVGTNKVVGGVPARSVRKV